MKKRYRPKLKRDLGRLASSGAEQRVLFCMLNPSTADEETNDRTITRVEKFARREGGTHLRVVNLYAARATNREELAGFDNPIGPGNDETIRLEAVRADLIVAAWGDGVRHGPDPARAETVLALLQSAGDVYRLGKLTMAGNPRHPLRLRKDAPLVLHAPCSLVVNDNLTRA